MKSGPSIRFSILVAALAFTACPPPDQNNTGGGAGGGVFAGGGGSGGGTAVTGGGTAVTGGGTAVTGGGTAVTGGGTAVTGGGDGTTGGGTAVTGGGDGTTGGGTAVTGGGTAVTGGGTAVTGGGTAVTGGGTAVTGGGTAVTGGGTATGTLCDGATPITSGQIVNDTTDGANNTFAFGDQNGCQGSSSASDGTAGDKLYVITVPQGMAITANLTTDWDSTFNLIGGTAACGTPVGVGDDPTTACVAGRDDPNDAPLFWVNDTGASVDVYLLVDAYSTESGDFTLTATVSPAPVCGNGMLEVFEACDDGNLIDGDGCSSLCALEFGAVCSTASPSVCQPAGETCANAVTLELNGTYISTTEGMGADINGSSADGCISHEGADSVFLLSLPPGAFSTVVVSLNDDFYWDSVVNIVEGLATCQASSLVCVDGLDSAPQSFTLSNPSSATANRELYVIVDGYSSGEEGPFTLSVSTVIPVCGDGVTEGAEVCDDSNLLDGDGCDSNCTVTACGNGVTTSGEVCDDANLISGDGCDTNCTVTACGNGVQAGTELCDDGNTTAGDGCSATCDFTGEPTQVSSIAVTGLPAGYSPGWGFVVENGQFVITITNSVDALTQGADAGGIGSVPLDGGAYTPIFAENQTQALDPQVIFYSAGRLFAFNGIFGTVNGVGGLYELVSGTPTARSTAAGVGSKYGWSWSADNFYFAQYTPMPYGIYGANGSATTSPDPVKVENIPSGDWGGPFGVVASSTKLYAFDSTQNLKVWSLDGAAAPAVSVTTGTPTTMTAPTGLCGWNDRLAIALDDPAAPTRIFYTVWGQPASSTSATTALGRICQIALDASGEPTGAPTVFAGPSTETAGSSDGPRLGSTFEAVMALTFDTTSQKLYVLQRSNSVAAGSVIRAITP